MGILLTGDTTTYRTIIRVGGMGQGTVADYSSSTGYQIIPGAAYTPDKWEKWEIDYVIGATTVTPRKSPICWILGSTATNLWCRRANRSTPRTVCGPTTPLA
jgi:hypothetical protein